jgi:hypothetical protein
MKYWGEVDYGLCIRIVEGGDTTESIFYARSSVGLSCSLTWRASKTAECDRVSNFAKQDGKPLIVDVVDIAFNGGIGPRW